MSLCRVSRYPWQLTSYGDRYEAWASRRWWPRRLETATNQAGSRLKRWPRWLLWKPESETEMKWSIFWLSCSGKGKGVVYPQLGIRGLARHWVRKRQHQRLYLSWLLGHNSRNNWKYKQLLGRLFQKTLYQRNRSLNFLFHWSENYFSYNWVFPRLK